jgi:hypothetical protein
MFEHVLLLNNFHFWIFSRIEHFYVWIFFVWTFLCLNTFFSSLYNFLKLLRFEFCLDLIFVQIWILFNMKLFKFKFVFKSKICSNSQIVKIPNLFKIEIYSNFKKINFESCLFQKDFEFKKYSDFKLF